MNTEQLVARAKAIAEFTGELLDEIFFAERLIEEIDEYTPDYEKDRRHELLEKAKIKGEVIAWLLKRS